MKSILRSLLALGLSCSFFLELPASAQNPPSRIEVVVVEGDGLVYRAGQRARGFAVRVEDDDHRPVPGASVVFALPVSGPSGDFGDSSRNYTVITDSQGLATAPGIKLNQIPGKLQIYVTASYRGLRANGLINQVIEGGSARTELQSAKTGHKWRWIALGILATAGAGGGAYFYYTQVRTTSSSPISITTGSVVFGGPH
jgi:hypothetical protein